MNRVLPSARFVRAVLLPALLLLSACERPDPEVVVVATRVPLLAPPTSPVSMGASGVVAPPTSPVLAGSDAGAGYLGTPTPDPVAAEEPDGFATHVVSAGDTLGQLALTYNVSIEELLELNNLNGSEILFIGQELRVPAGSSETADPAGPVSPSFKIIPDSELVYGPAAADFDVASFVAEQDGYLAQYQGEVEGSFYSGAEIVQLVADRYSVNPLLLLAALEYESGWVTDAGAVDSGYPMRHAKPGGEGLFWQLGWAADQLNWGYYGRAEGGMSGFSAASGDFITFAPDINDGTAGVQHWLAMRDNVSLAEWEGDVGPDGFYATYAALFGNPFARAVEPLWPEGLTQPAWSLPWQPGETWYFTGGPHGGWAPGSAWAALDFVPPGELVGCYQSEDWITAIADGVISRSGNGGVVLDVDGDGYAGTGWAITFMHLETRDRIAAGTTVKSGDRLGHPSCEGGYSNGTHVHISRTYNGRWVAADGDIPFQLGEWRSEGLGSEYDGYLKNGDVVKEACECREDINEISR